MSTLIVGSEGSMGKRYQAILTYLGQYFINCDLKTPSEFNEDEVTRVILATPTSTHLDMILKYSDLGVPILCEKPISKLLRDTENLVDHCARKGARLSMMMQYRQLKRGLAGSSYYNYFRHGNDGLTWDCFQIIALANGPIELREDSPIWKCEINNVTINLSEMDWAYVREVLDWVSDDNQMTDEKLIEMHEKVSAFELESKCKKY